jgi:hypothetical protein
VVLMVDVQGSKSSTGSMMTLALLDGSATMYWNVPVVASKMGYMRGSCAVLIGLRSGECCWVL